jgi:5-oxopent-3-ene-1,2,5-tricarboxylate decarboxylase / 2-hydroxyhepta-2,4-diene-1,7-dioate isomerase
MTPLFPDTLQTVYGSMMQHRAEHAAIGEAMQAKPYLAPPKAPVLYIKPSNTFNAYGELMHMPRSEAARSMQVRAHSCIGLIFKQNQPLAHIDTAQSAIDSLAQEMLHIALFADFSLPHDSLYRPPVKYNCMDGSLGLAQHSHRLTNWDVLSHVDIQTWVNGHLAHSYTSHDWLHSALDHLRAVNTFIAFEAGDVLMMGCPPDAPLVSAGDVVEVRCEGLRSTHTSLVEAI